MNLEGVRPSLVGLPLPLVIEANKHIEQMGLLLAKSTILSTFLHNLSVSFPERILAGTISAFYSYALSQNLEWVNQQTCDQIVMASLLQDIGLGKVADKLKGISFDVLLKDHRQVFHSHPKEGLLLLQEVEDISERVRQIIYQHHEQQNGQGFPNGIKGLRIYPPAKILGLASAFADQMMKNPGELPVNILRQFVADRELMLCFDGDCVKAMIKIFMSKKGSRGNYV